jgi:hypothetical protein
VSERGSIILLLSNYACRVAQTGGARLYFKCSGLVTTALLVAAASVSALSVVAMYLLVSAGGDANRGLLSGLMGLSLAVWSGHMALTRYRRHGRFEIDADEGVLRRYRAGRMTSEYSLDQITRVWLTIDATDGINLNTPPQWLQVLLDNGEMFRLAKGSRKELAPVCEAMRGLGLAPKALGY